MRKGDREGSATRFGKAEQETPRGKRLALCRCGCLVFIVLSLSIFCSAAAQDKVRSDLINVTAAVPREFPPYYEVNEKGKPVGFAIDVMERLAVLAGLRVTYLVQDSWTDVAEAVKGGRADLIPNIGISAEREAWLDYTAPVETFPVSIFVRSTTYDIQGADGLTGRRVAAVKFNVGASLLKNRKGVVDLMVFDNAMEATWELLAAHVDALVYPAPVLMKMVREAEVDDRIKIVGTPLVEIKRAVGVREGNLVLLERLNQAVNRFVGTAEYRQIYTKWFGRPQPFWTVRRVALAMSGLLLVAFAAMAAWRYRSMVELNRRLVDSMAERERAEKAQLESIARAEGERLKTEAVIAAIGDGISIQDTNYRVIYQNKTLQDLIGSHIGEYCYMAYEGKDQVCQGCPVTLSFEDGQVHTLPRIGRTDKGTLHVEVTASPLRNVKGEIIAGIEVVRDITERKLAEEALERLHRQNELILNSTAEGILGLDMQGNITFVNRAAAEMIGREIDELIGLSHHDTVHHSKPDGSPYPKQECPICAGIKDGTARDITGYETFWKKDGTSLPVEYVSNPIREQGELVGLVTTFRDITERRKLEDQLFQAQKMEAVGRLAGGVAHDFNNLMTAVIGNADLALMQLGADDPVREGLMGIKEAGRRASALTGQLLAFSRKQLLEPRVLDLNVVIKETEKMLRRVIEENVELKTVLAPDLSRVEADPTQIVQVIMNLAVNARDAMPHGGKLTIETANIELDEAYARGHGAELKPGPYVMLVITDTGVGMDEQTQSHIFEPFFTTKEKGKGTGLGLATVYGIVKQSGGFIWVYSEPGQGTTFKIYLPRAEAEAEALPKERVPTEELTGSETILIVEDDDSVRNLARRVFQRYGYTVLEAKGGEDALRVSTQHAGPIHLVLTDVVMPGMSGRELAEKLQTDWPEMKVLYMSGYMDNAIARHGILEPGTKFIHKPFTPESLARKLREVLEED
jgi:two-component system cell cycle sensor histidine kinase/response regulator CckA